MYIPLSLTLFFTRCVVSRMFSYSYTAWWYINQVSLLVHFCRKQIPTSTSLYHHKVHAIIDRELADHSSSCCRVLRGNTCDTVGVTATLFSYYYVLCRLLCAAAVR